MVGKKTKNKRNCVYWVWFYGIYQGTQVKANHHSQLQRGLQDPPPSPGTMLIVREEGGNGKPTELVLEATP